MNGDLLRTLEGPERCMRPRLIQSSTEGNCMIYYDKGQFCLFSVNGKLLGHMEVDDSIKVSKRACILKRVRVCVWECTGTCVWTTSVLKVPSLIKGFLTVWDSCKGWRASGGELWLHIAFNPEEMTLFIHRTVVRSDCVGHSGREHSRGVVISGLQHH